MGQVRQAAVAQFAGIFRPNLSTVGSDRRPLGVPKEMFNFHLTEEGFLYMPPANANLLKDFWDEYPVDEPDVLTVWFTGSPNGFIVQLSNGEIWHARYSGHVFQNWEHLATMTEIDPAMTPGGPLPEDVVPRLWVANWSGSTYMGYAHRGVYTGGQTWKITYDGTNYTVTDISSSMPFNGRISWAELYKGRMFAISKGRRVRFSDFNQPETFGEDSHFDVGGDDGGTHYVSSLGALMGMSSWEDMLTIFFTNSVWTLTGSSPDNFRLRQVRTTAGNIENGAWTLMPLSEGVLTYGGGLTRDPGIYLFTGSNAVKLSDDVNDYLRIPEKIFATLKGRRYILTNSRPGEDNLQFLIYNIERDEWVAFDGWENGVCAMSGFQRTTLTRRGEVHTYEGEGPLIPRAPGRGARITLGYHDEDNPFGHNRYLGVKIAGKNLGVGNPTVTITARVPEDDINGIVTSPTVALPDDSFEGFVVPVNIRGNAVEIKLEIGVSSDDDEVLIENLQLVYARKGEKLSRA